ncbi:FAD-dependent oxidoreductase [Bacillus sp. B190/17]|uniref:FAD-dependent oxidoreductase n=1 Tax=Bacillus lumedeiriae TaxID=3058829 RepID=A0ABW8ICN7_9BACI
MRIVIIGSGFGGLNAAIEIRKKLTSPQHEIIVVADKAQFVFRPSLIWLPFHKHRLNKMTFPLRPTFEKAGITFIEKCVQALMPKQNHILCKDDEIIEYDYLIVATGASPDWARIEGLEGRSASIYGISTALQTRKKVKEIKEKDPIVIGVGQGNPNQGIAYEFLFELEAYLHEHRLECPLTFFTYEEELFNGKGKEPTERLERLLEKKQVTYYCNVSIERADDESIYLTNGKQLPHSFLFVLPPYKGVDCIFASTDLEHDHGILPVHDTLQSIQWKNIYVIGDANNMKGTKSGRAAELQGTLAAENIIKQIQQEPLQSFQEDTMYFMELGKAGAMLVMDKPVKEGVFQWAISGMMPHIMKRAFEKYYLLKFS